LVVRGSRLQYGLRSIIRPDGPRQIDRAILLPMIHPFHFTRLDVKNRDPSVPLVIADLCAARDFLGVSRLSDEVGNDGVLWRCTWRRIGDSGESELFVRRQLDPGDTLIGH